MISGVTSILALRAKCLRQTCLIGSESANSKQVEAHPYQ